MGGNAIKHAKRVDKETFLKVEKDVVGKIKSILPGSRVEPLKFFDSKESFGDLDVLVEFFAPSDLNNFFGDVSETFGYGDRVFNQDKSLYKSNGNILSFGYKINGEIFQVDLIKTQHEIFDCAFNYFAYNDISNLLGRMSKKLGFKISHKGLFFIVRDPDDNSFVREVLLTRDYFKGLQYLALSVDKFKKGFESEEDIFKYVSSSPYFNADIYLPRNRSNENSFRDSKRKTYQNFLKYCEKNKEKLNKFSFGKVDDLGGYGSAGNLYTKFLEEVLFPDNPGLKEKVASFLNENKVNKQFKKYYNGSKLIEVSGLSGKELGQLKGKIDDIITKEYKKEVIKKGFFDYDWALRKVGFTKEKPTQT